MKNHYLEEFKKQIKIYVQKTDLCLANAEATSLKGATKRRAALKEANKLALAALEKLKKG